MSHEQPKSAKTLDEIRAAEASVGRARRIGRGILGGLGAVAAVIGMGHGATEAKVTPERPRVEIGAPTTLERVEAQPAAISKEAITIERQKIPVDGAEVQQRVSSLADKIDVLYSMGDADSETLSIPGDNGSLMRQVTVKGPDGVVRRFTADFPSSVALVAEATGVSATTTSVDGQVRSYDINFEAGTGDWYGSFDSSTGENGGFETAEDFVTATANIDNMLDRANNDRPVSG